MVGNLRNGGGEWQPKGCPVRVDVHDFPGSELGKAIPYGVYDIGADTGFVVVGDDHDTAAFAAATIGRWWDTVGAVAYPDAKRLLITADAGGSNGYRSRLFHVGLAKLAERAGIALTVCHFPPGTSKWKKIEHRLFSHISMNWRGRPLTSHQVIVDLIAATPPHRLAVTADMTGNSRYRPPLLPQTHEFHVFLLCQHQERLLSGLAFRCRQPAWRGAPQMPGISGLEGGEFQ